MVMTCVWAKQGRHTPTVIAFCVKPIWECHFFRQIWGVTLKQIAHFFVDNDYQRNFDGAQQQFISRHHKNISAVGVLTVRCSCNLIILVYWMTFARKVPYLSGRAFDCRSRGLRFEPGWALSLFFFVTSFSQAKLLTNLFYDLKIRHKSSRVLELYSSCL